MKKISFLLASLSLLILSACEDKIDIKLKNEEPKLVIESWLTDQAKAHEVKVSLSAPYLDPDKQTAVSDATVSLSDDAGNRFVLNLSQPGVYTTPADFQAQVGRTYTLSVLHQGVEHTARTTVFPTAVIDNLRYVYVPKKSEDKYSRDEGYYVQVGLQDTPGEDNYYKLDLYVNDVLTNYTATDIAIIDDRYFDGNYLDEIEFNNTVNKGDKIRVELLSISKEAYEFYRAVEEQVMRGNIFDKAPANVPTNLSNGALGFFGSSSVLSLEGAVVEE